MQRCVSQVGPACCDCLPIDTEGPLYQVARTSTQQTLARTNSGGPYPALPKLRLHHRLGAQQLIDHQLLKLRIGENFRDPRVTALQVLAASIPSNFAPAKPTSYSALANTSTSAPIQ